MIRIINIGELLCLIYYWHNYHLWSISTNESNILSSTTVNILKYIPVTFIKYLIALLDIIALYKNTRILPKILYASSLILFDFLLKISLSTLLLEDTTTFLMFKITNPIPLELKLHHLANVFASFMNTTPELLINRYN